jgi:flagellar biosynthesis protein FlhG
VDADLGLANLHLLLGIEPDANLSALLAPGWSPRKPRPNLLTEGPAGLRFLPGASGVERLAGLNRGELRRLVHRLEPYLRGNELVVVDLSSGVSPPTRLFLEAAQEVVIVSNPEPSAMLDAYGVVKLLSDSGHSGRFHLVMNRARDLQWAQECAGRIRMTAQRFLGRGINTLGCVPEDEAVIASVQRRRPVVLDRPSSPAAAVLETIARQLHDSAPSGDTLSLFFSTAKRLVAPRRRSKRSTCAL